MKSNEYEVPSGLGVKISNAELWRELLLFALPYMEDAADEPCYNERGVKACKEWVKEVKEIVS